MIPYWPLIAKYAALFGLCPFLVAGQIQTESSFNPRAVSPVGAIGLMQLMPSTAEWLGYIDEGEEELLFDPELNIRAGCHFDAWLRRYWSKRCYADGELEALMTASYNAGARRIKRGMPEWFRNAPRETRNYVRRVLGYRAKFLLEAIEREAKR